MSDPASTGGWARLRALLAEVLDLDEAERAGFVAELAATEPEVASRLEELVRADAASGSILDDGLVPLLEGYAAEAAASAGDAAAGRRLGAWRLVGLLGRGGMGTVYLAERSDGAFDKQVAIKVLRRSVDTPELKRRFLRERQLLASLDHPSIVKVLDGGVGEDDLPWFALERVAGAPITRFASERRLSVAERLHLVIDACEAVEAAHRHLVVHRDLKPSNLLVDAEGRVRLLDFGIAKLLEEAEGESLTRTGMRLLTPQYAAPEQILGQPATTAVDVYGLGVLLYELLTGELPHERSTTTPAGLALEVERETVRPPSRRLLELDRELPGLRQRAAELAGDLDAVVLKSLRREPRDRYQTPAELAADLRAFLEHRPVAARQGSRLYSVRKFLERHRLAVAAATAIVVASVAGAGAIAYEARVARAERDQARIQAETARQVSAFLTHLFQQADPARTRGAQLTAREVLASGAQRVEKELAGQPEVQATLRLAIGSVERDLGLYDASRPLLEEALAQRRRLFGDAALPTAETLLELGSLDRYLDRLPEASRLIESALRIREGRLGPNDLDVARAHWELAVLRRFQGDSAGARHEVEHALAIADARGVTDTETGRWRNGLGLVLDDLGDFRGAEAAYREAIVIIEKSGGGDGPLLALPLDNLGMLLRKQERFAEAEPVLRRAVELVGRTWGEGHTQYATALNSLGALLLDEGRCRDAIPVFERSAAVYAAALGAGHRYVAYPVSLEGDCRLQLGDAAAALALYRRALALRGGPEGDDDAVAESLDRVGVALTRLGRLPDAEATLRRALAVGRRNLEAADPRLADILVDVAACLERRGEASEARALDAEALGIYTAKYPPGHSSIAATRRALARLGGSSG